MFFKSSKNKKKKVIEKLEKDPNQRFALRDIFEDERLANLIASQLGINSSRKEADLQLLSRIKNVNAKGLGIKSLSGIEFLNNLKTADFSDNNISDLPEYKNSGLLYKNRNTLVYMDLSNNPFLDPNFLFSLDNTENRKRFLNQFEDGAARFNLGDVQKRIYDKTYINPSVLYEIFNQLLPKNLDNREYLIQKSLLKYFLGKEEFYKNNAYQNAYVLQNNQLFLKNKKPTYLEDNGINVILENFETILPEEDAFLIKSIINHVSSDDKTLEELEREYKRSPSLISPDFTLKDNNWIALSSYNNLEENYSDKDDRFLKIDNKNIRKTYSKFLEFSDILKNYREENPAKSAEINDLLLRSREFVDNFLNNYIAIQDNTFLEGAKEVALQEAEVRFNDYINSFKEKAKSLFEDDLFNFEVDLKYMDMLTKADKKDF